MRVLMLNYEYPPLGGGAANATARLLEQFAGRRDLAVHLVASSPDAARVKHPAANIAVDLLDIGKGPDLHYQSARELLRYSWRAWRCARRLLAAEHYDLCHAFFGVPCGYVAKRLGLPYIVSLRGSDVPFYNERFRWRDRLAFRWLSPRIWRAARRVVANSAGLRELALASAPGQRIDVIPNGVDTEMFHPAPRAGGGLRIICVSRLIPRKGIEYLIRAVARLAAEDVILTLVGTGNDEARLRALIRKLGLSDRARLLGQVDHTGLPEIYRQSNVFVLPSLNEGMSNAALEAMASGLPIVVTETGGAAELLEDGENGYLVAMRSDEDIAERLHRYMADRELVRRHGARARAKAETMSWTATADAYERVYREALAEGQS